LPTIIFITRYETIVHMAPPSPSCIAANKIAGIPATIDPIFGIKFNKNAKNAHNIAYLTPIMVRVIQINTPVNNL